MHRVARLFSGQPAHYQLGRCDQRLRILARGERARGLVDRGPDPRVSSAAAQVPTHPRVDLPVVGRRVRLEQRRRGQGLPGLAVTALHNVAAVPSVANGVDDTPRCSLDCRDGLPYRPLGRGLAGLRVAPVDQDGASRAEARSAAELRAVHPEDVAKYQSSGVFACRSSTSTSAPLTTSFICDLPRPEPAGPFAWLAGSRQPGWSRPHRMMVIPRYVMRR